MGSLSSGNLTAGDAAAAIVVAAVVVAAAAAVVKGMGRVSTLSWDVTGDRCGRLGKVPPLLAVGIIVVGPPCKSTSSPWSSVSSSDTMAL